MEFETDEFKGTDKHINSYPFWKKVSDATFMDKMKGQKHEDVSYLVLRVLFSI